MEEKKPKPSFILARWPEWLVGAVVFLVVSRLVENLALGMPYMLLAWMLTTGALAIHRIIYREGRTLKEAKAEEREFQKNLLK